MEWLKHVKRDLVSRPGDIKNPQRDGYLMRILNCQGWSGELTGEKQAAIVIFGSDLSPKWMFTGWVTIQSHDPSVKRYNGDAHQAGKITVKLVALFSKHKNKFKAKEAEAWYNEHVELGQVEDYAQAFIFCKRYNNVIPFHKNVTLPHSENPIGFLDSRCCLAYGISQSMTPIRDMAMKGPETPFSMIKIKQTGEKKRAAEPVKSSPKRQKRRVEDLDAMSAPEIETVINPTGSMLDFKNATDKLVDVGTAHVELPVECAITVSNPEPVVATPVITATSIVEPPRIDVLPVPDASLLETPDDVPKCVTPDIAPTPVDTVSSFYTPIVQGIAKAGSYQEIVRAFPNQHAVVEQLASSTFHYKTLVKSLSVTSTASDWETLFIWLYVDHLLAHGFATNTSRDKAVIEMMLAPGPETKSVHEYDFNLLLALIGQTQRVWSYNGHAIKFNDYNSELPQIAISNEIEAFIFFTLCRFNGIETVAPPKAFIMTETLSEYLRRIA